MELKLSTSNSALLPLISDINSLESLSFTALLIRISGCTDITADSKASSAYFNELYSRCLLSNDSRLVMIATNVVMIHKYN